MKERKRKHDDAHFPLQGRGKKANRKEVYIEPAAKLVPMEKIEQVALILNPIELSALYRALMSAELYESKEIRALKRRIPKAYDPEDSYDLSKRKGFAEETLKENLKLQKKVFKLFAVLRGES